jgi:hypothetical protein
VKTELGMTIATKAPKATPAQVDRMINELRRAKRSMLAAELAVILFGKDTETAKRRVRAVAKAAKPRIVSFPGSDGYDLFARVKIDDLWRCVAELEDAAKTLLAEAAMYRRALHAGYRGEPGDNGQQTLDLAPAAACQSEAAG